MNIINNFKKSFIDRTMTLACLLFFVVTISCDRQHDNREAHVAEPVTFGIADYNDYNHYQLNINTDGDVEIVVANHL